MFSTKKVIATAILGSAIAFPTSTLFTSVAHAEDNITAVSYTHLTLPTKA